MGMLTVFAAAAVLAISWTLISLVVSPPFVDEDVVLGRAGTFVLLRGILPAIAAGLAIWVGLASARNRSLAPHVPILAVFVVAVGASQALTSLWVLQVIPPGDGSPSLPRVVTDLFGAYILDKVSPCASIRHDRATKVLEALAPSHAGRSISRTRYMGRPQGMVEASRSRGCPHTSPRQPSAGAYRGR